MSSLTQWDVTGEIQLIINILYDIQNRFGTVGIAFRIREKRIHLSEK